MYDISTAAWFKKQAIEVDFDTFKASQVEKLSGDNTLDNKKTVLDRLANGWVIILLLSHQIGLYYIFIGYVSFSLPQTVQEWDKIYQTLMWL